MLKYLMKLRHRKAFTLVELVIVIAILALLMVCVAAFSTPVQQMMKSTSASVDAISANKIIGDYIENRLAFASKICVVYAVDATMDNPAISNNDTSLGALGAFVATKDMLGSSTSSNSAGVLIFRYEADPAEPEMATYKLYDVPITSSTTNYTTAVDNGAGGINNPVFADHFYSNSQNLILPDLAVQKNKVRGDIYTTVNIIPYDISGDYIVRNASGGLDPTSVYIKPTTLKDYYTNANPDSVLDGMAEQRSGSIESVTFELQNIKDTAQWSVKNPGGGTGSDILIFYYIPRY